MAQEDQPQSNNSSGGGVIGTNIIGRSCSKRQKPKKVPQRGLGVAQLEKIRIEEQHKKDAILPSPPTHHKKSSFISLPIPRWPTLPGNGSSVCSNNGSNNGQRFWSSCEQNNTEKECCGLDPGLAFRANLMSLPYESEPIWPLPGFMQRAQQIQQPSSSMVNLSSRTSPLNFQMEPPSNQSYYGNPTTLLPEEEKMVGMKRSYPFTLDNAPGPPLHTKYPHIVHPINGKVEAASISNGSTFNFEPGTPNFREGLSCSTSKLESNSKNIISKQNDKNGIFDGDFLTLAPPTTTSMSSTPKFKHPPSSLSYYNCELPDLDSLGYQGSFEDSIIRQASGGGLNRYRPYYSFLPPAMGQIDRATSISMANCNCGEVDLNLKL